MDIDAFERWWRVREHADIVRMIGALGAGAAAPDRDVCHVLACAELDVVLRRSGRRRAAGRAAHRVHVAVREVCRRTGVLDEDRDGAVHLARAAGEAARAMVCDVALPCRDQLLGPFRSELPLAVAS